MKIVVIGGTGTIGSEVVSLLQKEHDVITVGRTRGDYQVDIEDKASIENLFKEIGTVDGVISTSGDGALGSLTDLTDENLDLALNSKLKGQINVIRTGVHSVKENGFIIITTGTSSHGVMPGASSISMATAGLNGYVRAVKNESFNGIKINAVSPGFVKETAEMMQLDIPNTISAHDTARVYKMVMDSNESGIIAEVPEYINSEQ